MQTRCHTCHEKIAPNSASTITKGIIQFCHRNCELVFLKWKSIPNRVMTLQEFNLRHRHESAVC